MATVQTIYDFVKTLAPETMAYEDDSIGLLCGRAGKSVRRILIALDVSAASCAEAKALGCELLVTHHPALRRLSAVSDTSAMGANLLFLAENGIAAVNAHTNLDCAPGGVNDCLAAALGLSGVCVLDPTGVDENGRAYGLLRGGSLPETEPEVFAAAVKKALGCEGLRYASGGQAITKVAVGGGSCADFLGRVAALGYQAFVTADVKYHTFCEAAFLGVTLIDAGHFETENPVCAYLVRELAAAFPDIAVFLSKTHADCTKFL